MDTKTINTLKVLDALRLVASNVRAGRDGRRWGQACIADAQREAAMTQRRFAGLLSALEAAGLYEPMPGTRFGFVVMAA